MLSTCSSPLDPGDDLHQLVSLLRHRVSAGEPFAADSFIQEANVYSAAPADLVGDHARGTDLGEGKGTAWYFCSPANYHQNPGTRRRKRKVVGGGGAGAVAGETCWHVEKGASSILGTDKKSVGAYKRTLSYVQKIRNPPGAAKPFRNKSLGWIMVEIGLEQQEDPDRQQLVICKVYRSPRRDVAEASVAGGDSMPCTPACPSASKSSSSSDDKQVLTTEYKTTLDHNLGSPVVGRKPALSIRPSFKPSTRCRPVERKITSGVAIVKKGSLTAAVTVVMKFGGSSMKSVDQMKEMAKLVFSFPAGRGDPVVVLSAMGNTTNNLLVAAGKALSCSHREASKIHELAITTEMHLRMIDGLGLDRSIVSGSLDELEHVFMAISMMNELTSKTQDYLVSFGSKVCTRIFSAYLNKLGKETAQEWESYAVDTCGSGGSDLAASTIGRDLGSREIQVWKDVDGVLTCDPNVCASAVPVPYLTFDEAAELGMFGAQSMQLAMEGGMSVIVKNLGNPQAPGTMITKTRDMSKSVLTSILLRSNITVLNIESTRMVDQSAFLAMSFSIFGNLGISVDCVAISEGKISLIIVPPKLSSRELVQLELDNVVEELQKISVVDRLPERSVISLIGNPHMSATILVKSFNVLRSINVEVQKFSQGSSKVINVSLVVDGREAEDCVRALHAAFFQAGFVSNFQGAGNELPVPANSSQAASSSGVVEPTAFPIHDPIGDPAEFFDSIPTDPELLDSIPKKSLVDGGGWAGAGVLPQVVQFGEPSGVLPESSHGQLQQERRDTSPVEDMDLRFFFDDDDPLHIEEDLACLPDPIPMLDELLGGMTCPAHPGEWQAAAAYCRLCIPEPKGTDYSRYRL